jgi:plasmid segregation protein ParM
MNTKNSLFSVDDGSTTVKVAKINTETDEISASILAHSFATGHKTGEFGRGSKIFNFTVNHIKYHFNKYDSAATGTTNISFQYSSECVMAVHLALLSSTPISQPEDITVYVTLPLDEYYSSGTDKNMENINRKIKTILQPVEIRNGIGENGGAIIPSYNITKVQVVPEALTAVMLKINDETISSFDNTLCVDIGGSTLDLVDVQGNFEGVQHKGFPIGVHCVIEAIINSTKNSKRINQFVANHVIKHINDSEELQKVIKDPDTRALILEAYEKERIRLSHEVTKKSLSFCKNPDYVVLVGGGISLVDDELKKAYPKSNFLSVNDSQTEQVIAILEYALNIEETETEQA